MQTSIQETNLNSDSDIPNDLQVVWYSTNTHGCQDNIYNIQKSVKRIEAIAWVYQSIVVF